MIDPATQTDFLQELAELAAAQTLPRFRSLSTVDNKDRQGFDPVTEADREAEKAIRNRIMERFPDHGIEGEEFGRHQPDAAYRWVIDPVDGTRAFISGVPVWGTLIALCHEETPIAGMMSQPFTGELFIAVNGEATYLRNGEKTPLGTSSKRSIGEAILMTTAPELFDEPEARAFASVAQHCRMVRYGTDCYAYCMLAAGQVDLVIESGLSFYDIAALIPLIENAGGIVTDWQGKPFGNRGRVIAAANSQLHEKTLAMIQGKLENH